MPLPLLPAAPALDARAYLDDEPDDADGGPPDAAAAAIAADNDDAAADCCCCPVAEPWPFELDDAGLDATRPTPPQPPIARAQVDERQCTAFDHVEAGRSPLKRRNSEFAVQLYCAWKYGVIVVDHCLTTLLQNGCQNVRIRRHGPR